MDILQTTAARDSMVYLSFRAYIIAIICGKLLCKSVDLDMDTSSSSARYRHNVK